MAEQSSLMGVVPALDLVLELNEEGRIGLGDVERWGRSSP